MINEFLSDYHFTFIIKICVICVLFLFHLFKLILLIKIIDNHLFINKKE